MKPNLYSYFYNLVEGWIDEHIDTDEFPFFYIHPELAERMAKAAELVFDVAVDSQNYADTVREEEEYGDDYDEFDPSEDEEEEDDEETITIIESSEAEEERIEKED